VICLFYYNLFRALPDQHASVMQENFVLKQQLQQRTLIPLEADVTPPIIPPQSGDHDSSKLLGEIQKCQQQLQHEFNTAETLRTTIQELQAAQSTPGSHVATAIPCTKEIQHGPLPILVLCHNRVEYLQRTLDNLIANRPSKELFPIIVSEDGDNADVWKLINGPKYYEEVTGIQFLERGKKSTSYHYISQHFKFAISTVLDKLRFTDVIILEDDMEISKDFFAYFLRVREELYKDDSLYTASAWNDNGQGDHGRDPEKLKRSEFFPGLGWIMTGKLWNEFREKWPPGYWDDWMREPEQRKGRHCIFPEISRSWTFGEQGSSKGQFWSQFLKPVTLYSGPPVPFESLDLSYLDEKTWTEDIRNRLKSAQVLSSHTKVPSFEPKTKPVIIQYSSDAQYDSIARYFNIMYDEKAGIHRTAFKGVVYFWHEQREVYLVDKSYKETFNL